MSEVAADAPLFVPLNRFTRYLATEAGVLAVLTLGGYGSAFFYQTAHVTAVGLPMTFATPQLTDALIPAIILIALLMFGRQLGSDVHSKMTAKVVTAVIMLALLAFGFWFGSRAGSWVSVGVMLLIGVYMLFASLTQPATSRLRRLGSVRKVNLHMFLTAVVATSLGTGFFSARIRRYHYVTNQDPPKLVIKVMGDTLLLADYDPETGTQWQEFSAVKLGDSPDFAFHRRYTGMLTSRPRPVSSIPPATSPTSRPG